MEKANKLLYAAFIIGIFLIMPAMADSKYMAGSPELSAYITGTNEFAPGDNVSLTIVIDNTGLNEFKFVNSGIVDREDQPNTAKFLTVTLLPGDAPLVVKSDPQMVGDLPGASNIDAVFTTKIDPDAPAGSYTLLMNYDYTYLYTADQYGVDTIQYTYKTVNGTLQIPIKIKPEVSVHILSATPDQLNAGTEGYIDMKIQNAGSEDGQKSVVMLLRNGNSPIVPVDSSVYIGDFPVGGITDCRYKVMVGPDAQSQTYPVDVVVLYQNTEGDFVTSRSDTIGVPVGAKVDFAVISPPAEMNPGASEVIDVEYKNTGDITIYNAQARISAVDPFTSDDDVAYLGDLKPGESAIASYDVSVDPGATLKEYALDSTIQYRDSLDNTYVSDTLKVSVDVTAAAGVASVFRSPVYVAVIVAALIAIAYLALHFRKKSR